MPSQRRYHGVAIALHWLIALAVLALIALGYLMGEAPRGSSQQFALFQWHKSIGITVLLLSLIRLAWRLTHRPPPMPADMPVWEQRVATATHILFYVFLIGLPLTGWAAVSASPLNIPTVLYGVIPWPHLPILPNLENKREVGHLLGDIHGTAAWTMAALIALHAAAAIRHHVLLKDDVLRRMAPFLPLPRRPS